MATCPYSHIREQIPVKPEKGNGYVLLESDTKNRQIYQDYALPVKLLGCLNCKTITIQCPTLEPK